MSLHQEKKSKNEQQKAWLRSKIPEWPRFKIILRQSSQTCEMTKQLTSKMLEEGGWCLLQIFNARKTRQQQMFNKDSHLFIFMEQMHEMQTCCQTSRSAQFVGNRNRFFVVWICWCWQYVCISCILPVKVNRYQFIFSVASFSLH